MDTLFLWALVAFIDSASINNSITPIEWNQVALSGEHTSMSTLLDSEGGVYLCGGKVSLYSKSSKCIRIEVTQLTTSNRLEYEIESAASKNIKAAGPFPGIYFNAKAFSAETQNEGGIHEDRMCMLSISDGTNKPKCWCCDLTESKNIECDDLQYTIKGGCPNRFEACVVHDPSKNVIYQIGIHSLFEHFNIFLLFVQAAITVKKYLIRCCVSTWKQKHIYPETTALLVN